MNILVIFFPVIFIFLYLIKISKQVSLKKYDGDFLGHYAIVKSINSNNNKIPLKHPRVPVECDILIRGTRFYHWFIGRFSPKIQLSIFNNHKIYFLMVSYIIYSAFYINYISTVRYGLLTFLLFSILYLFAPYQHNYIAARNSFSVRPIGELFISIAFIIYSMNKTNTLFSYLVIFFCFSGAILLSKFSRQVILFSGLPISILNNDIFYFIVVITSFLLLIVFFRTVRMTMQSQYYHLKYFWSELYNIALKNGWIAYSIKKLFSIKDIKSFVRMFPGTNLLIIFLDYPIIWICFFEIIINKKINPYSSIILSLIFIAFITSFKKLRMFGEGKRYLDYVCILSIFYAIKNLNNNYLFAISTYSIIYSIIYILIEYQIKRLKKAKGSGVNIIKLLDFIKKDSLSIYYCLPFQLNCYIEAFTQHKFICPAGWEPWKNDFDFYSDMLLNIRNGEINFEIDNNKIKDLKEEFGVNRILLHYIYSLEDKKGTKRIFQNEKYSIFEI